MPKSTADIPAVPLNSLFLFIGPADSGKSYAATSFGLAEDPRPCYLLELDGREQALRGRPVVYDNFSNLEGAIGVIKRLKEVKEQCNQMRRAPFHTCIIDGFTSFCDFALTDSLEVTEGKREDGKEKGRVRGELLLPTIEDYGYEAEAVRQLLFECLFDLKRWCNVIVTAHEVEKYKKVPTKPGEPTRTELDGYKLLARDKISAKVPTKFDEIYHFLAKDEIIGTRSIRRQVKFNDEVARTSFPQLTSTAPHDITGKEFYNYWKALISTPLDNTPKKVVGK